MKKAFCDRCGVIAERPVIPTVSLDHAEIKGRYWPMGSWATLRFFYRMGDGSERDTDLCQSCMTAFCEALIGEALKLETEALEKEAHEE